MIDPGAFAGNAPTGQMPFESVEALRKALTAGQTYNIQDASGGQALRIQSLDTTMQAVIQDNQHFKLFNRLAKPHASATVDEWTEQSSVGGFLGGSTNTETGTIAEATGVYTRRVGLVKYLMTKRQVSYVVTLQNAIADAEAIEYANGALQLLTDAEFLCFEGDSAVVATEFDGIQKQLIDLDVSNHIVNMQATPLASQHAIVRAAATISSYGNFGTPTDIFLSQQAQSDLDNGLDPAFRVPLTDVGNGGTSLGAPVVGIRTSWGNIVTQPDVFIRDEEMLCPMQVNYATTTAANVAYKGTASAVVTATQSGAVAGSQWTAAQAGWYYYAIAAVGPAGESDVFYGNVAAEITQALDSLTVTITNGSATCTGYAIYRSKKYASKGLAEAVTYDNMRLIKRIPLVATTTPFVDKNTDIPGTTKAYILNMSPSATAITWRQLLPMVKFPLYPTTSAVIPWAQLLFGYLRISKRRHAVMIKNILTNSATWRPFG